MIYCVEDERNIRELLIYTLETTGFKARGFGNGNELMKALKEEIPELILLDIMLPGDDGYTILEQLKSMPSVKDVPVIMVTAKEAEFDKVKGLEGGADDYITKPFSLQVVLLRVEAVLRRTGNPTASSQRKQYTWRALCLDPEARSVTLHGQRVALTQLEFDLLALLLAHPRQVFTRAHLLQSVWGYDFLGEEKAVNIHIMNLRRKLGREIIETVRGVGYRLGDET